LDGHLARGLARAAQARHEEAVKEFATAEALDPSRREPALNRMVSLLRLSRHGEAAELGQQLARRFPSDPQVRFNLAEAWLTLDRCEDAEAEFNCALALAPRMARALVGRALARAALTRIDEAWQDLAAARRVDPTSIEQTMNLWAGEGPRLPPDPREVLFVKQHERMQRCDWTDWSRRHALMVQAATSADPDPVGHLSMAFSLFSVDVPREVQLVLAHNIADTVARLAPRLPPLPPRATVPTARRLRLGYLSGDFRLHPLAILTEDLFSLHDSDGFEVFAYSYGENDGSSYRRRIAADAEHFVDLHGRDDLDIARRIRGDEIDVLVDFQGYTRGARPFILASRPAPVQMSWLAYVGTCGAPWMDYIVADRVCLPPAHESGYSERVLRLPRSFWMNSYPSIAIPPTPARSENGLPLAAFVFCCFNQHFKITPGIFAIWMRLLAARPDSVLWLLDGPGTDNLRREAERAGINPARLVFSPHRPHAEHLARLTLADLLLDTPVFNAHTTASDALWTGVPVLTCPGETFQSRVAASLVIAVGLEELVVDSFEQYEALALELSAAPARLALLRAKLMQARRGSALFDTAGIVRDFERGLRLAVDRSRRGLPPETINVPVE